ncbi:MAG: class I SAM-dependent methyltransferase [Anaerolineae bacterium]|nr:class I SAM-dependent methyltransferase [Anaerolineae bacterium]
MTPLSRGVANLRAIKLLKQLEAEQRTATRDEQVILSRFTGYGSSNVLAQGFTSDGKPRGELAQLLTPAEIKGLLGSSLNAHYTSLEIVRVLWRNVLRLYRNQPPTGLRILEPAVGTGNFLSCMPSEFQNPDVYAIELEAISAAITRHLHPCARLFARGFEAVDLPDDVFDIVIGNWPFGNYRVADSLMADKRLKQSIHNYFFAKAMDVVKPGGIIMRLRRGSFWTAMAVLLAMCAGG